MSGDDHNQADETRGFDGSLQGPVIIDEAWTMTADEFAQFVRKIEAARGEVSS